MMMDDQSLRHRRRSESAEVSILSVPQERVEIEKPVVAEVKRPSRRARFGWWMLILLVVLLHLTVAAAGLVMAHMLTVPSISFSTANPDRPVHVLSRGFISRTAALLKIDGTIKPTTFSTSLVQISANLSSVALFAIPAMQDLESIQVYHCLWRRLDMDKPLRASSEEIESVEIENCKGYNEMLTKLGDPRDFVLRLIPFESLLLPKHKKILWDALLVFMERLENKEQVVLGGEQASVGNENGSARGKKESDYEVKWYDTGLRLRRYKGLVSAISCSSLCVFGELWQDFRNNRGPLDMRSLSKRSLTVLLDEAKTPTYSASFKNKYHEITQSEALATDYWGYMDITLNKEDTSFEEMSSWFGSLMLTRMQYCFEMAVNSEKVRDDATRIAFLCGNFFLEKHLESQDKEKYIGAFLGLFHNVQLKVRVKSNIEAERVSLLPIASSSLELAVNSTLSSVDSLPGKIIGGSCQRYSISNLLVTLGFTSILNKVEHALNLLVLCDDAGT